jgi:endonuclease/exonuclease/phosphatase family metal-dependent hydrolase
VAVGRLTRWLHDAWAVAGEGPAETIPAREPTTRIDYVLVSQGFSVERVSVPQDVVVARASDHRPVVADLELGEA